MPLRALRRRLTRLERQRLRELGRTLTLAVEATCRNFDRGETEADVAGHLAHRLIREGVVPVDLRVASDDRLARYPPADLQGRPDPQARARSPSTGRRHGLCAVGDADRLVRPGRPTSSAAGTHLATMVDATCIFFSRPGEPVSRGLPPGPADLREVRPSPRMDARLPGDRHRLLPPRGRSCAPTAPWSSATDTALAGARASARPAPKTPSSSTPAATRSSPRPRTGRRSRSPSRASSSPGRGS